jgi:hypothetical protein
MAGRKAGGYAVRKVARNAGDGRFVTKKYAETHPKTTEVETVKIPIPTKKPEK